MHKLIATIILLALSSISLNTFSAADKVVVCHKGDDLSIARSALAAHLAHGDTEEACEGSSTEPEQETKKAVVMMRCEAIGGNGSVVVSASSSVPLDVAVILPIPPPTEDAPDCAVALAGLLNAQYMVTSITSGSAQSNEEGDDDDSLHLYTDYVLIAKVPTDS